MFLLEILGNPIPQQQTRHYEGKFYNPNRRDILRIQWQLRPHAPCEPLAGAIHLDITFYFPVPKSASGIRRRQMLNGVIHHIKRPDADNCAYLIANALKGIFYKDDSQIIDECIHKRYGEIAKTVIKVTPFESISKVAADSCE